MPTKKIKDASSKQKAANSIKKTTKTKATPLAETQLETKWSRVRKKVKASETLRATRTTGVDVAALKHTGEKIHASYVHEPEWEKIIFRGIRTHNLKDIDITIPKWQIIAVAWVSGSWKSSFAFDTVYKEGQYRYIESLSSYLRQFFNLGERPDIDYTRGLSPAIAIEQNKRVGNARSTVGTLTEIDDYLRLMYAKLGDIYSYGSGKMIKPQNIDQIVASLKAQYAGQKVYLVQEAGKYDDEREFLKFVKKNRLKVENNDGFTRFLVMTSSASEVASSSWDKAEGSRTWEQEEEEDMRDTETYSANVSIITKAREKHKKEAVAKSTQQESSVVEYFYLESPRIPEKFFPVRVYGIFDRVTIDDEKLGRIREDIIKILSMTKKFGVYQVLGEKQASDSMLSKAVDKDVYNISHSIQWFTDKNYCPDCDISYPDFTTQHFSPNRWEWACQHCHGLGEILKVDMDRIIDPTAKFEKAIIPWRDSVLGQTILKKLAQKYSIDEDKSWKDLPKRFQEVVINGDNELIRLWMWGKYTSTYYNGIQDVLTNQYNKGLLSVDFQAMFHMQPCPECHGAKLRKESMYVFLYTGDPKKQPQNIFTDDSQGLYTIYDLQRMRIRELIDALMIFQKNTSKPIELINRIMLPLLDRLNTIAGLGLGHLNLHRQIDTLSWWEIQRLRLAKQLGNKLTGIMYVLDEPTIGLDDVEIHRTIAAIKTLKEMGNTIIVVEHNDEFIKAADWIVEIGPGSGDFGGKLLFSWPYDDFVKTDTLTAQYITGRKKIEVAFDHHPQDKRIKIKKAHQNNLQNIDTQIRLWWFTIITWPSGAGKTTLMYSTLYSFFEEKQKYIQWYIRLQLLKKWLSWNEIIASPIMKRDEYETLENMALQEFYKSIGVETISGHDSVDNVVYVDQSSIGKTPRSCPATFIWVFDNIRKIFAGVNEAKFLWFNAWHFSFNSDKWACPACEWYGYKKIELQFLPDTYVPCDLCHGHRYKTEILSIQWKGHNIAQILEMYVYEALELFKDIGFISEELQLMCDIGLGYLRMWQPAHTLSWWESQRIKLVKHLLKQYKGHSIYFLDEPTVGLHPSDIEKLLLVLKSFLDRGDTILMIEHDKTLLQFADDVIYLEQGKVKK
jgi:excinuclease ABC subunit A